MVTGAAGYVGSVVTERLVEEGHAVVAIDSLKHGHRAAVHRGAEFTHGDLLDQGWLLRLLHKTRVEAVVHLAAEALIDESIRDPGRFFRANVCGGSSLLDAMVSAGVDRLIFSSTAAVYGSPAKLPITEHSPHAPVNSYGESKLAFERMLTWYRTAHGIKSVSLRYFNAAGATKSFGEFHVPETHLIPLLFETALKQRPSIQVFGTDYETPDGSCVRDYIHVSDIAHAHVLALAHIERVAGRAFNMGNGAGYSNLQVIETVQRVTGLAIPAVPAPRRPGDPPVLIADATQIREGIGWEPKIPELERIVQTAWDWRLEHPQGYANIPASPSRAEPPDRRSAVAGVRS
jgi:UDP-glucose 4-epimerase